MLYHPLSIAKILFLSFPFHACHANTKHKTPECVEYGKFFPKSLLSAAISRRHSLTVFVLTIVRVKSLTDTFNYARTLTLQDCKPEKGRRLTTLLRSTTAVRRRMRGAIFTPMHASQPCEIYFFLCPVSICLDLWFCDFLMNEFVHKNAIVVVSIEYLHLSGIIK